MKGRKEWMLFKRQNNLEAGLLTGMWCFFLNRKKKEYLTENFSRMLLLAYNFPALLPKEPSFFFLRYRVRGVWLGKWPLSQTHGMHRHRSKLSLEIPWPALAWPTAPVPSWTSNSVQANETHRKVIWGASWKIFLHTKKERSGVGVGFHKGSYQVTSEAEYGLCTRH